MSNLQDIIWEAERLIEHGIYDPEELYGLIQKNNQMTHYSQVRKAIHIAKTSNFKGAKI